MNTDEQPYNDDEYKNDFYQLSRQVQESVARGEPVPPDCMPHEHPLWIVLATIMGKQGGGQQGGEVSAELLRKLENSVQKMLKNPVASKQENGNIPVYVCAGLMLLCLLLFGALFMQSRSSRIPPEFSGFLTEMRTCKGPHVMRLQDGSCTMRISSDGKEIRTYSWKIQ